MRSPAFWPGLSKVSLENHPRGEDTSRLSFHLVIGFQPPTFTYTKCSVESPPNKPPIIDYASPDPGRDIPFLNPMMLWRSACGWFFLLTICILPADHYLNPPKEFTVDALCGCVAGVLVCSILTLTYMWKAAIAEVGIGYALRQTVLALILLPIVLLGVFVIPVLVQSDLLKWRRVAARNDTIE